MLARAMVSNRAMRPSVDGCVLNKRSNPLADIPPKGLMINSSFPQPNPQQCPDYMQVAGARPTVVLPQVKQFA